MKEVFFFLLILVFNLFGLGSQAQDGNLKLVEIGTNQGLLESAFRIRPEGRYRQIKGSPYLDEEWTRGKIWLDGDSLPGSFEMRYNVYGNEMQFISGEDTFAIANPLAVEKIMLNNRMFEYLAFEHNENENMAYFEILTNGGYRLLQRHQVDLLAGREPLTPYHPQNEYDRFAIHDLFYIQLSDQPNPIRVPGRKRDWYGLIPEKETQLGAYFKNHSVHLNKAEDLIEMINYLNQLQ